MNKKKFVQLPLDVYKNDFTNYWTIFDNTNMLKNFYEWIFKARK